MGKKTSQKHPSQLPISTTASQRPGLRATLPYTVCWEQSHAGIVSRMTLFLPNVSISRTFYVPFLNSLGKRYTLGNGLAKWVFCEWQPQTWMWTASLPRGCFLNGLTCHSHFHPLPSLVQKNSGSSSGVGSRPALAHCSTLCLGLSWEQGSSHLGQHRIGVEFSPEVPGGSFIIFTFGVILTALQKQIPTYVLPTPHGFARTFKIKEKTWDGDFTKVFVCL